ncbi:MAG: hypothetical protein IJL20_03805 [Lachnospiraceae bacterium]|nr:hypothetical protein [Lachnospiraceae bacterium]
MKKLVSILVCLSLVIFGCYGEASAADQPYTDMISSPYVGYGQSTISAHSASSETHVNYSVNTGVEAHLYYIIDYYTTPRSALWNNSSGGDGWSKVYYSLSNYDLCDYIWANHHYVGPGSQNVPGYTEKHYIP